MKNNHERELTPAGEALATIQGGTYALAGVAIVDLRRSCAVGFSAQDLRDPDPAYRRLRAGPARAPAVWEALRSPFGLPPCSPNRGGAGNYPTEEATKEQELRTSGDGEV